jgi:hypothetical protein
MRRVLLSFLVLLVTPTLVAAGWKKAYFGATPPGSWARYSDTAPEMSMTLTMTRLPDEGGSARLETQVKFASDQYPPVWNRYTLRPGFALDRQLIDYMAGITAGTVASGENRAELDADTIKAIIEHAQRYEPAATFKGTETVDGKKADRYAYTVRSHYEGVPDTIESGELWLSDAVPFGLVKQTSVTKDDRGKVTTTYERRLVASGLTPPPVKGTDADPIPVARAEAAPAKAESKTLLEAYDAGLVEVTVTIAAGTPNGERAHLAIETKDGQPLTLVIPKGRTSLHVDIPLDDFVFDMPAAETFALDGSHPAELDVKQLGEQRAMDGTFVISTYEGSPMFRGSATVGWVKKKK